jgi:peptide deformylase
MEISEFSLKLESDPILYQTAEPFDFQEDYDLEAIEQKMIDIMDQYHGIGISGNQVGFLKRVIVVKPRGQSPFALFNPEIIESSSHQRTAEEGCLSFPGIFLPITRTESVTVKYLDRTKTECIITLSGLDAKCVQHEIDHLNGITFTKHVSSLRLTLARKQQRKKYGRTK